MPTGVRRRKLLSFSEKTIKREPQLAFFDRLFRKYLGEENQLSLLNGPQELT
jgi:hypothetical protein